ncbi:MULTISPECIES: YccS family putative transporter [Plesiomonas]|nr:MULTISPECIES: YccS family putative transporter [Plesiomonas]KAB7665347.1 TIGR01666 family membrane protein [Plesiomonas shigelloides]KAB7666731.1 TIGR01666 family membrane protein [Plesiomonas shigelloides]KAB7680357.1 TIGR01666 family membrane protein [Plesiomonas shigelloides]KAB7685644.1 TIGR01666 family membrane protein [Plesiomonas shigelloides]KAB7689295.1 TIGR01666 family membrane protein [Plesiomonas shigelloides]
MGSFSRLRHSLNNSRFQYCLMIFIALAGAALFPWLTGEVLSTIPVTLGVVAAALTDLDDRLSGRLRNIFITLLCFFIASVSIEILFPYPWLFAIGLLISSFCFTMLGAIGQRYATISFGALLIAIYTMLGVTLYDTWYQQPLLLLAGAVWYSLIALLSHALRPVRPVQENLANCYELLARYLDAKSAFFDPDEADRYDELQIQVALSNGALVSSLNQTKLSLLSRLKGDRGQRSTRRLLRYYFVAQDIHERASSAHNQYHALAKRFRHSDVLFRFQRLLLLQAKACRQLAKSIISGDDYNHDFRFERAFNLLNASLERHQPQQAEDKRLLASLNFVLRNLQAIDWQLSHIESEQIIGLPQDNTLADDGLHGIRDIWTRIRNQLTPGSALFRHAVRMSLVLCAGYACIMAFNMERGYWILLTSLFVCQPNYSATRLRLRQRVLGTLAGIIAGLPLLYLIPSQEGQLVLIVVLGVLFFAFRTVQYGYATAFITMLVLFCFNLMGAGFDIAIPRVTDTLIGCGIAWLAVTFVWPDWRYRRLPLVIQRAIDSNTSYLSEVIAQYQQGKDDSLSYRIARRAAHNADAELASVISNMSSEPLRSRRILEEGFRLLCLNHAMLGYISALGAHRHKLPDNAESRTLLKEVSQHILHQLQAVSAQLQACPAPEHNNTQQFAQSLLEQDLQDSDSRFVLQQLGLINRMLNELSSLTQKIVCRYAEGSAS